MRIIISPAKKMSVDTDSFPAPGLPRFLNEAEQLKELLQSMSFQDLKALWKCSDSIARQNMDRLRGMDLRHGLTPAIVSYEGIQYRYMAPGIMETLQLDYLQGHLRILSGLYGLLRPFDGVTPYRLEMQAKLAVGGARNLYAFWGGRLAEQLAEEGDWVLNLASKEYSKAVLPYLPEAAVLTCVFGELQKGGIAEKGTLCKMARGQMVRWLAENRVEKREDIREFSDLGYRFRWDLSRENQFVFIKGGTE